MLEWQNQQDQRRLPDNERNNNNNSVALIKSELTSSEKSRTNKTAINKPMEMRNDSSKYLEKDLHHCNNKLMRSQNNLLMIAPLNDVVAKFNMEHRIKTEIVDEEINSCNVAMTKDISDAGRKMFTPSNIKENNPVQFKGCHSAPFDTSSSNIVFKNNLLSVHIERAEVERARNFANTIPFRPMLRIQDNSSMQMERQCSLKDGENGQNGKSGKNKRKNVGGAKALGEKRKRN